MINIDLRVPKPTIILKRTESLLMKKLIVLTLAFCSLIPSYGAKKGDSQVSNERSMEAVVRNKYFYKANKLEVGIIGGLMPYDSLVNHYMAGGKATWHLSDHFGWEVIDAQVAFPSVTSYARQDIVANHDLSNLQTSVINFIGTTNLLISPLYGKIRFIGKQVLYFDIYLVLGGGVVSTKTIRLRETGATVTETTLRTGLEGAADFGLGFKIFMSDAFGLVVDLRDYLTFAEVYSSRKPRSNFAVYAGLTFFLPNF